MAERKTERKEKGAYLQRGPTCSPTAQPTSPPLSSSSGGKQLRAGHAEAAAVLGHLLLPPCHICTPGDASQLPHSILPLHELPPPLSRPIRRRPRRTPERRRAPAWPPCSPRRLELSRGTA